MGIEGNHRQCCESIFKLMVCDFLQVMLCLCIFVVLVFVSGRYCMCVGLKVLQSSTCVFQCCCWLLDLLGVASKVGILKMSLCDIPHLLVFTRGRASIVLAFSSWCI